MGQRSFLKHRHTQTHTQTQTRQEGQDYICISKCVYICIYVCVYIHVCVCVSLSQGSESAWLKKSIFFSFPPCARFLPQIPFSCTSIVLSCFFFLFGFYDMFIFYTQIHLLFSPPLLPFSPLFSFTYLHTHTHTHILYKHTPFSPNKDQNSGLFSTLSLCVCLCVCVCVCVCLPPPPTLSHSKSASK
jgi:hypothetical protein